MTIDIVGSDIKRLRARHNSAIAEHKTPRRAAAQRPTHTQGTGRVGPTKAEVAHRLRSIGGAGSHTAQLQQTAARQPGTEPIHSGATMLWAACGIDQFWRLRIPHAVSTTTLSRSLPELHFTTPSLMERSTCKRSRCAPTSPLPTTRAPVASGGSTSQPHL